MNSRTLVSKSKSLKRQKGRPPQADARQFREEFLANALTVFLEKGYAGSSIEGIARYARVSKNTIYLQYQTKENLFEEAARYGLAGVHTQLNTSIDVNLPFDTALLAIIERIQALAADTHIRKLTRLLIAEAQRFPDIAPALLADFTKMMEPISAYLRQAANTLDLSIEDPSAAASDLSILALGGFEFLLSEPETSPTLLKERATELRDFLLKGWQRDN